MNAPAFDICVHTKSQIGGETSAPGALHRGHVQIFSKKPGTLPELRHWERIACYPVLRWASYNPRVAGKLS